MSDIDQNTDPNRTQSAEPAKVPAIPWYSRLGNLSQIISALFAIAATVLAGINLYNSDLSNKNKDLAAKNESLKIQSDQMESQLQIRASQLRNTERRTIQLRAQSWTSICTALDEIISTGLTDSMFQNTDVNLLYSLVGPSVTYRRRLQVILDRADLSRLIVEDQALFRAFSSNFTQSLPTLFDEQVNAGESQNKSAAEREPFGANAQVKRFNAACEAAKPS